MNQYSDMLFLSLEQKSGTVSIRMQIWKFETGHIYDLDYDIQLTAALDILKTKDFKMLVSSTKTLKELQQEAEAMKLSENQAD